MNLLRYFLLTILFSNIIFPQNTDVSGTWIELNPNLPRGDYRGVFFRGDTGWVTGEYGTILKTYNGGTKWNVKQTFTNVFITSIHTFNGQNMLASAKGGYVLRSNDAGESWDTLIFDSTVDFWKVKFIADNEAWICGTKATLLHTTDAGNTWVSVNTPATVTQNFWSIDFFNNFGVIAANNGEIYKSTDGGHSWINSLTSDFGELYSVKVIDSTRIICGGESGKIYFSSDFGTTWNLALNEMLTTITDFAFSNDTTVYAVGDEHELYYKSFNGGRSFVPRQNEYFRRTGVFFPSETTGYTVGPDLSIFKSTDGGEHWQGQVFNDDIVGSYAITRDKICILTNHSSQSDPLVAVYMSPDAAASFRRIEVFPYCSLHDWFSDIVFFSEEVGLITATTDGQIFRTSDGGNQWSYICDDVTSGYGGKLYKYNENTVYAVFANKIYKTTDAGELWSTFAEMDASMSGLCQSDSATVWLAARDIYKSSNSGSSWEKQASLQDINFKDIIFINEYIGLATTASNIFRTTDGGNTWSGVPSSFGTKIFRNGNRLFLLGGENIGESTDLGATWFTNVSLSGKGVTSISMLDGQFARAYGSAGLVLKEEDQVTSSHSVSHQPVGYELFQNYPNPFNPSTVIRYSVAKNSFVSIKIFNTLGKEILTLVNEEKPAGTYEINFNARQLASGMYIYKITAGSYSDAKSMLLIK